ncbi:type II toxin-antitoxin system VapC family toxin [Nodosilinea sp. P-1105]|uniref:type II toxin-antitoxin system VapC family toxin n=1 Tax=Nodosilinea sp. P-1105 TaxID=2546229 RepID=UPI00146A863D|nr:type II toxin-antitoxin system VapC family toxin [Nodosilinea sp. P-1105]NMF83028.1 PIN domain-containing protein [Nodosilinea sp. P-1105]
MKDLVIDSSVVIKWIVPQACSKKAGEVLTVYQAGGLRLLAPDLLNAEVGNILWKYHSFQGLTKSDVQEALEAFKDLEWSITPSNLLLDDALNLAIDYRRTVYDSLFIALALREGCQLVTADERLVNAVSQKLPQVVLLSSWSG